MKVRNIDKLRVSEFKNAAAKLEEENVKGPFNAGIDLESFSVLIKDPEFEAAYKNAYRDQPVQPGMRFLMGEILFMVSEAIIAYKKKPNGFIE